MNPKFDWNTANKEQLLKELLEWIKKQSFTHFHLLYSGGPKNSYPLPHTYDLLFGARISDSNICSSLSRLANFSKYKTCFGFLSYDLKNQIEDLDSLNTSYFSNKELLFYEADIFISINIAGDLSIISNNDRLKKSVTNIFSSHKIEENLCLDSKANDVLFTSEVSDGEYLKNVKAIQSEIIDGNVYEMNYCRNYRAEVEIDPYTFFAKLADENPSPYSCLIKTEDQYVISSSMERFLCRKDNQVISQPIKGTLPNSGGNEETEKEELLSSEKDRAENLMIVDLVRNDLNRISEVNSVKVDELFGIYSYPTVHQMISTISSTVPAELTITEILHALFPMGSMTGAPKLKSMELIEHFESFKRGIYSGAIGYILPTGDFDFNVVIRSVIYDSKEKVVNIPVGSAITIDSIPDMELAECGVKINKIQKILSRALV